MTSSPPTTPPSAPGRIFINYRRDDTGGHAGRLADGLNEWFGRGRVFRDVDGIRAGANFQQVLQRTASEADAMIVLIGRHWTQMADAQGRPRLFDPDDWVAREIASALERQIPIFPVLVESAAMPRADELPPALQPLAAYNAMSISDQRWASDVTRLARVIAFDLPVSAAERLLLRVQQVVTLALVLAIAGTAALVSWNLFHALPESCTPVPPAWLPLSRAVSGVSFVVVLGCAFVLLYFARLLEAASRRWIHAAVVLGVAGTLAAWLAFGALGVDDCRAPAALFGASTALATLMLGLVGLSRFTRR